MADDDDVDEKSPARGKARVWIRGRLELFLDGTQKWGDYRTWAGRYGTVNHWLVLYPPGTSAVQRRALRLCESWRTLGLLTATATFLTLALGGVSWVPTVTTAVAVYVLGVVVTNWIAGPVRARVVRLAATKSTLVPDPDCTEECDYLILLAAVLTAADDALDRGISSAIIHERVWSAVYDEAKEHLGARVSLRRSWPWSRRRSLHI